MAVHMRRFTFNNQSNRMKFIMFIYLKTSSMKVNWKKIALYVLRIIELVITGAAGGTITQI